MNIWIEKIHLDLNVNWKLSRNQTTFKENFIIHLDTSEGHFRSEIAPNIRYGETLDNITEEFDSWPYKNHLHEILTQSDLSKSLSSIKLHSLRFGLESVLLSYFASRLNLTLTDYLHLPPVASVATSFSMPIMPVNEIADYLRPLSRFDALKIKVDAASGKEMLLEIKKLTNAKLRLDANEAWSDLDDFLKFENSLKGMNIELIEQPFPSKMVEEYKELKKITEYKLLADESIEDIGDFNELSAQFHAVNIKLMKTGSLLKAKDFLLEAKKHNLEAMMGCMIETTIGISYGMLFSGMVEYVDLDGFLLIKDEPFRLVKEAEGKLNIG